MDIRKPILISLAVILLAIVLNSALYVVPMPYHAIVTQFGKVLTVHTEPGLRLKIPIIQSVEFYDSRLREWDGEPNDLPTMDKKNIELNTWARWRITDVRKYYESLRTESGGQSMLDSFIESSVKNVVSNQPLMEILRNTPRRMTYLSDELEQAEAVKNIEVKVGRELMVENILTATRAKLGVEGRGEYGFEVEGVGVKHINFVREIIPDIYKRMRSERERIAERYRSEGREAEAKILGEMQKELETIESQGAREATILRGQADAEVLKIYAEAYGQDSEFYFFTRSLELLPEVLGPETRIVLSTGDSDLFRMLRSYQRQTK
jgi:membrane protease subunit HflC